MKRKSSARALTRRLRWLTEHEGGDIVFFLGAGCSVSSGVPCAAEIAKSALADQKYLETGKEGDVDAWAARNFVGYDPDDPASVYAEIIHALHPTAQERQLMLERITEQASPGFGYAMLTQLMTHSRWGQQLGLAMSTNFDDLLIDALHLYGQKRPTIASHETLTRSTLISRRGPRFVKLSGDAHLPMTHHGAPARYGEEARERIRALIGDACLLFIGYGGRDAAMLDLLEGLPDGQPRGGVYWVNETAPKGAFADWLNRRDAIHVEHSDFDELMFFLRLEFSLGHPRLDRFEKMLRAYWEQYKTMSEQSGFGYHPPRDQNAATPGASAFAKSRRSSVAGRREKLKRSLQVFSAAIAASAREAKASNNDSEADRLNDMLHRSARAVKRFDGDPDFASLDRRLAADEAEEDPQAAAQADERLGALVTKVRDVVSLAQNVDNDEEALELIRRALDLDAHDAEGLRQTAELLLRASARRDQG